MAEKKLKLARTHKRAARNAAEDLDSLVGVLERWQQIERDTVALTTRIGKTTDNVLVQTLMKIIQQDSKMHHKVQQVLIDSLTDKAISLRPEELGAMWDMIEDHAKLERETIRLAEQALQNCRLFPQRQLLMYLLEDERKHDKLLTQLENFKRKIYPYM